MTELSASNTAQELSADLSIITAEINTYQRIAGEAIFEIGRRLKHVKENDLAHGEFGRWLDEVGINDRMARKFITVAREFEGKRTTSSEIGLEALYQIATLPPEQREAEHITAKGETKKPDEMTVRELRDLKRQLKAEQSERERLERENEKLANRPPRIEYIQPKDYATVKAENMRLKSKYGEGVHIRDAETREKMYREFSEELDRIRLKYGAIALEVGRLGKYIRKDAEFLRKINDFDDFWEAFAKAVLGEETIIEMGSA